MVVVCLFVSLFVCLFVFFGGVLRGCCCFFGVEKKIII